MVNPVLQIKDLTVSFPQGNANQTVLEDISFDIYPNEVVAIVGESGSGKTITSLSILKLLQGNHISKGEIQFNIGQKSIDLLQCSESDIKKIRGKEISMIFQEPMSSLNPLMTIGNQVIEAILCHNKISKKEARKQTLSLFNQVGLPTPELLIHNFPHQLSGGQKQRVMIAMAISCKPQLLIADEPTTALDVTVQKTIIKLLKSLQQLYGMSIMYISHDLNLVTEIADRVVVMNKGRIVESGNVKEIFLSPKHPYTIDLLRCSQKDKIKGIKLPVINDASVIKNITDGDSNHPDPVTSANLIEVKYLTVRYPLKRNFLGKPIHEVNALDGVSFNIAKGEILGVVGESGSGKTTLGRTLIGLIKPTSGTILHNGIDLISLQKKRKDDQLEMQIVFQDPFGSLNPRLTIGKALEEPIKVQGKLTDKSERLERVNELLIQVNLDPNCFNRYPHQFSGGQRQRICIARALALNPQFIIFDESVSALDVSVQSQVLNLINELRSNLGFTCMFISHDLSIVRYMSDRIMVLKDGKIEELGDAEKVFLQPTSNYTRQLIAAIPGNNFLT